MKSIFDQLSYQCSSSTTANYSTSFSLAVKMLSPSIQPSIHAIYGFVRLADEIVDSFHDYDQKTLFQELEANTRLAIARKISINPILNAFQHVVHKYGIELEQIDAFLSSMKADMHKSNYDTVVDYEGYIYGSADVVGLMCLKVFVNGNAVMYNELKEPAMKLGSAFQKVNFLRDLKDDSEILNRNYFPHLQNDGLTSQNKKEIIFEIEKDFADSLIGIRKLPMEARFGVYTAYRYYRKLLIKLEKADTEAILNNRIRISNPVKATVFIRSFIRYKLNVVS